MPQSLKKFFLCRLIFGLIIAIVLWLVYSHAGSRLLRPIAVRQIRQLTSAKIELKEVDFQLNGAVRIDELLVRPPDRPAHNNIILKAGKVYARFGIWSLLTLRPRLEEIIIQDLLFNAQYDSDVGQWNIGCLKIKAPAETLRKWPVITIEKGTIKCSRVSKGRIEQILALDINAEFSQAQYVRDAYTFRIATTDLTNDGPRRLEGLWRLGRRGTVVLIGGISSLHLPIFGNAWSVDNLAMCLEYDEDNVHLEKLDMRLGGKTQISLSGTVRDYATQPVFEIQAKIKDLFHAANPAANAFVYTRPLLENLRPFVKSFFDRYKPRGWVDIDLEASGKLGQLSKANCLGRVICTDVSFRYEKFPYEVRHLAGVIDFTDNSAVLNNLLGKHGDVDLVINGYSKNFGPDWDCRVRLTSSNMLLDDELYKALNTRQKKFWFAFAPTGLAHIDYRFTRRPEGQKEHTLAVELLGAKAAYQYFPYPLENLAGRLFITPGKVEFSEVVSRYDGREIIVNGHITDTDTTQIGYEIVVSAKNIPIDSTLKAALPDGHRQLYDHFDVNGLVNAQIKVFPSKVNGRTAEYAADVAVMAERLRYAKLPLTLTDISAKATLTPELIQLERMTGSHGAADVSLSGRVWPAGPQNEKIGYCLLLRAEELEISSDFVRALSQGPDDMPAQFQAEGRVNLSAELNSNAPDDCPDYRIALDCLGNSVNFGKFRYPLRDVVGTLLITKDNIYFKDITAAAADDIHITPNAPSIKLNGNLAFDANGFEMGRFSLSACDILFDERLDVAFDAVVPDIYDYISPTGRFDLNIDNLKIFKAHDGTECVDFAGNLVLKNCAFGPGQILSGLDAVLNARWLYTRGLGLSAVDASFTAAGLELKGKFISSVKTDVYYSADERIWATNNFVADCYGGKVAADFKLKQLPQGGLSYTAQVAFDDIDVNKFLASQPSNSERRHDYTSGLMSGSLAVEGILGDDSTRTGTLRLSIRDMQAGKLSLLAKLLYVLKLSPPGDFAFEHLHLDSYIKQHRLFFEQINIEGKAVCLRGSGRMDLRSKKVDLDFTASGPRLLAEPPLLQSLAQGLGPAVVEMKVTGDFHSPKIQTATFPVIRHTLEILGTKPREQD